MNFFSVVRQQLDRIVHLLQKIVCMLESQAPDYSEEDASVKKATKDIADAKNRLPHTEQTK